MKIRDIRNIFLICLIIFIFVFQNPLQQWKDVFRYADEGFALLVIPVFLICIIRGKFRITWTKKSIAFAVLLLIFWLSGWFGYIVYHYQPFINTAKDAFVNLKFFMAAGVSFLIFAGDGVASACVKKAVWYVVNFIAAFLFVLCIADLVFGFFDSDIRGGLRAVRLFYSSYTALAGSCVFLSGICIWFYSEKKKKILLPLAMLAFVLLSTRRVKAFGAIACMILLYLFVLRDREKKTGKKVMIFSAVIFVSAAAAAIYQILSYYYFMGVESARAVLTIGAPFIAADHFPFGTGWGTYGSAFSTDPYSPVYGMYRMAGVWGLSPDYAVFVSDTFWPMVMGQCGYFGFAALLGVLFLFVRKVFSLKEQKSDFASALFLVLYLFISSTSESAFANPVSVPLACWLGFIFAQNRYRRDESDGIVEKV